MLSAHHQRITARGLEAGLIDLGLMPNGRCSPI
jgi:hypothetical protein